jgi:hypothetical protein
MSRLQNERCSKRKKSLIKLKHKDWEQIVIQHKQGSSAYVTGLLQNNIYGLVAIR